MSEKWVYRVVDVSGRWMCQGGGCVREMGVSDGRCVKEADVSER